MLQKHGNATDHPTTVSVEGHAWPPTCVVERVASNYRVVVCGAADNATQPTMP